MSPKNSCGGKNPPKDYYGSPPAVYGRDAWEWCEQNANVAIATAEGVYDATQNCKWLQNPDAIGITASCDRISDWNHKFLQADQCQVDSTTGKKIIIPSNCKSPCSWVTSWPGSPWGKCKSVPDKYGSIKRPMIDNIMEYYNIPNTTMGKKRVILFDDEESNLNMAKNMGIMYGQASKSCKGEYCDYGCGITCNDFKDGINHLDSNANISC